MSLQNVSSLTKMFSTNTVLSTRSQQSLHNVVVIVAVPHNPL